MDKPQFVYVIYMLATPEAVWNALTDKAVTRRYWEHENVSDWKVGSTWEHVRLDAAGTSDGGGQVVESDPPRRLVLTWGAPGQLAETAGRSRVSFEIEALGEKTRLTVIHT